MNKTVDLVNLWVSFEKAHPQGEILYFAGTCWLKNQESNRAKISCGAVPPDLHSKLSKLIGRIAKIHAVLSLPY